ACSTCTSSAPDANFGDGSLTSQVGAIDKAGTIASSPAGSTSLVDTSPPDTSITSQPSNPSGSSSASFEFSGTDPSPPGSGVDRFECKLDGAAFSTCTSPAPYSSLDQKSVV